MLRYQDKMYSVCMSILKNKAESQEATQDTFLKAFKALKDYNADSKFSSWLYKIAYRTSLDYIRKRKKTSDLDTIEGGMLTSDESKTDSLENKELSNLLLNAMDSLPEEEAVVLRMFYLEEMSIKELEEITGLSKSNVKVKLFRARKKMADIIQNNHRELEAFLHN